MNGQDRVYFGGSTARAEGDSALQSWHKTGNTKILARGRTGKKVYESATLCQVLSRVSDQLKGLMLGTRRFCLRSVRYFWY